MAQQPQAKNRCQQKYNHCTAAASKTAANKNTAGGAASSLFPPPTLVPRIRHRAPSRPHQPGPCCPLRARRSALGAPLCWPGGSDNGVRGERRGEPQTPDRSQRCSQPANPVLGGRSGEAFDRALARLRVNASWSAETFHRALSKTYQ